MDGKTCTKCDTWKPLEDFPKVARRSDGRDSRCRDCKRALDRAAYVANPERKRAQSKQWAQDNPSRKREQSARSSAKWRQDNPEARRASSRTAQAKRRAAERGALFGEVDWEAVRHSGTHCHICGCRLPKVRTPQNTQPDHLVALAAGGSHAMNNLAPAHAYCNRVRQEQPLDTLAGAWTILPSGCCRGAR